MLAQSLSRWANITPTLGELLVLRMKHHRHQHSDIHFFTRINLTSLENAYHFLLLLIAYHLRMWINISLLFFHSRLCNQVRNARSVAGLFNDIEDMVCVECEMQERG